MTVQPRLASTVMLLRDTIAEQGKNEIEVFMVRRVVQSEFMPDIYVFPGGSVSADDRLAEQTEGVYEPVTPLATDPEGRTALGSGARAAAIRELFEEANVLLAHREGTVLAINEETVTRFADYRQAFNARKGSLVEMARAEHLVLATNSLAYFAHWITPEGMPKRFDTHFFVAAAPSEQEALYDNLETSDGVWIRPTDALERFQREQFPIAFPTFHQLRDLSAFHTVQEAIQATATRYVAMHIPILHAHDGAVRVSLPEDPDFVWKQA
ncbi:MAG: NUDIX hydrolase [Ktedonobacteraceae bacterium]